MSGPSSTSYFPTLLDKLFALRCVQPFDRLPADELALLAEVARPRSYAPGEVIHPGEIPLARLLVLAGGRMADSEGTAGPIAGVASLLNNAPSPRLLADPAAGAQVLDISKRHFFTLARECPEFVLGLMELGERGLWGLLPMTIRRQIFLLVTLLFFGVGAAGSAVALWLETEVLRKSFDDKARGLVITMAEFIEPADVAALKRGEPLDRTRLEAVVARLQRWAIGRRLFLIEPGTNRLLGDTAPAGAPVPAVSAPTLGRDEVRRLAMRVTSDGHSVLPLVALTADGAAIVGVEIFADDYFRQRADILHDAKVDAGLVALIGVAVATVLGLFISRPISRLEAAVDKIGSPAFSDNETDSVIQEVADLGSTFSVMHRVLGETMEKAHRSLLESDYYRNDSGLAAVYRREFQPSAVWSGAGAEAAWLSTGAPPPAAMAGAMALGPASGAAFAGIAGPAGELTATVRARAAGAFLADALSRQPLAAAAAETRALFGLKQLIAARWQDDRLECWSAEGETSGGAPDPAAWSAGAPIALACLGGVNRERLDLYLANFSTHATDRILAELPSWLDAAEPGVVLVLRLKPAAS